MLWGGGEGVRGEKGEKGEREGEEGVEGEGEEEEGARIQNVLVRKYMHESPELR